MAAACYDAPMSAHALRVLLEPELPGAENMRRDTALWEECHDTEAVTLRLYTWRRPTISVGWMQDPAALLNLRACREAGVDVVRRPTGGRAILHADEITYAVVAPVGDVRFGDGVAASHARIATCLAAGLAILGVRTQVSRPTPDPERRMLRQPCFTSSGRAELLVGGRKLVGSAQRRGERAFLQHGSLLVDNGHQRLVDFLLDCRDERARTVMRSALRRGTTTLREQLGYVPSFDELAAALAGGFTSRLDVARNQSASPI